jgi:flagellar hook protein FlgE
MSIFSSLFTGANGLTAHGDAIGIVGDDISNASTVGFKENRAVFEDMIGGAAANGQNLGQGSRMSGPDTLFGQGTITNTGQPLDMAVQGNGFFVVKGDHNGVQGSYYTRDGQFKLDNTGTLVNQEGLKVQGYTIDATGKASQAVGDLVIGGQSPPNATTKLSLAVNLDSSAVPPPAWNAANPSGTSNYSTSATVYDSLGTAHRADIYFRANGSGSWEWHAMVDGGELAGGTPGTPTEIASGTATFNTAGALQAQTTTTSSASFVGASANQAIKFSFGDDIASGGTGLAGSTQFSAPNTVNKLDQDGYGSGDLSSVQVSSDGTITGQFSNGQSRPIARVALATFASEKGLQRSGSQLFSQTQESGQALVDGAATGSRGSVVGSSLEQSNVDIGNELVTLIAYQRAFSANAKTVSTADQMLQEVVSLKQ